MAVHCIHLIFYKLHLNISLFVNMLCVYRSRQQIFTAFAFFRNDHPKLQCLLILTPFLPQKQQTTTPPMTTSHTCDTIKQNLKPKIGLICARTRRTATIALERRGWHRKHEPEQPGGHAARTEGNTNLVTHSTFWMLD